MNRFRAALALAAAAALSAALPSRADAQRTPARPAPRAPAAARAPAATRAPADTTGASAIRQADLRADLYALAGDSMRGREAGTPDELRAAAWLAERARAAGLEPAGEDGTYFQFFPLRRVRTEDQSTVSLGGRRMRSWSEALVTAPVNADVDLPLVFVGEGREADVEGVDLHGKAVAAVLTPAADGPPEGMSVWPVRYARAAVNERAAFLAQRGAAAVLLVADSVTESAFGWMSAIYRRGTYGLDSATVEQSRPRPPVPVVLLHASAAEFVRKGEQRFAAHLVSESFTYPSVNVVARVKGTDQALRREYVLFSGHVDHDGVRAAVDGDTIYNGADDNGSVDVALLAIGRAFVRHPELRSALFVWHGAEERGLLGSRWFVWHPTVPNGSIVAVLNGDMIGRNSPDSAALLGAVPPHRNSAALVRMALDANDRTGRFAVDTTWDSPTHPEGWYFRSDHLPYARAGIPAIFFTTLLHADYHTPRDERERIDYAKLRRTTLWMYETGRAVASAAQRPAVDPDFKLER